MRGRSPSRDPSRVAVVGMSMALVGILWGALVPVVPHPFSTSFVGATGGDKISFPADSWVTGRWSGQFGDTVKFLIVPAGGSPVYQKSGTSGTFAFLASQTSYRFYAGEIQSNHSALTDRVFLNGTYAASYL